MREVKLARRFKRYSFLYVHNTKGILHWNSMTTYVSWKSRVILWNLPNKIK